MKVEGEGKMTVNDGDVVVRVVVNEKKRRWKVKVKDGEKDEGVSWY